MESDDFFTQYGSLYQEFKIHLKHQVGFYLVFALRRFLFVVFTFFMRDASYSQIIAMNYLNLSMLIYNGHAKPFKSLFRSRVEITNEVFITMDTFHFMLFTDFTRDVDTQFMIGWSLVAHIVAHIFFNLSIVIYE